MLTSEDMKRHCNLRVGGDRARVHPVDSFEARVGETGRMALEFIGGASGKDVTLYFNEEGAERLLSAIIGARPIGMAIKDEKLYKLCRMLIVGYENRQKDAEK